MKLDAKTLAVVGSIITALGGAAAGVIQATKNSDNNEALFRTYRVEVAVLKAKVAVLMKKTNVVLDVDLDEIMRSVEGPQADAGWSPFPLALAQEMPPQVIPMTSVMIGPCRCECPVVEEAQAPEAAPPSDQEMFQKELHRHLKQSPRSVEELKAQGSPTE